MDKLEVYLLAVAHFSELDGAYWLTVPEVTQHANTFTDQYFDPKKLGGVWGYTPELALTAQLDEYCRENFGWTHPNEGM